MNDPSHKKISLMRALQDLFDAITMQDRLDGGISILMRCAGSEASETLSPEHFTVDLAIGGDLSALVQAFSEEFVIPHLQRYAERCRIEGIIPPQHCAHIQCSACPTKQFEHDFEVSNKSLSAAVQMGQALAKASPSKSKSDVRQRQNADAFLLNATHTATIPKPPGTKNMTKSNGQQQHLSKLGPPLISIDDHILPKLHQLIGSIHSSRWEAVLQSPKWNLTYEQAFEPE
ncbi:hypothetical protein DFH29DRAFT_877464 [Suillus ampliporus]|nr:hypothetical protein DFH29DRAFT_877464 [Suillus ampliporus]